MLVGCPYCRTTMQLPPNLVPQGQPVSCPQCRAVFSLGTPNPLAAAYIPAPPPSVHAIPMGAAAPFEPAHLAGGVAHPTQMSAVPRPGSQGLLIGGGIGVAVVVLLAIVVIAINFGGKPDEDQKVVIGEPKPVASAVHSAPVVPAMVTTAPEPTPAAPSSVEREPDVKPLNLANVDWRGVNDLDELRRARTELQSQIDEAGSRVEELRVRRNDLQSRFRSATGAE